MVRKTVLTLGGGFGGLTAAQHLRRLLPLEHRIVVVACPLKAVQLN
ncbi:MAG: hypothetical protein ACOC6O_00695 [Chloroflexota bacterium]